MTRNLRSQMQDGLTAAVTAAMRERGRGLRELYWSGDRIDNRWVIDGLAQAVVLEIDVDAVVRVWADRLGLDILKPADTSPGIVEAIGTVDDVLIRIWGIVDRDAWQAWLAGPTTSGGCPS